MDVQTTIIYCVVAALLCRYCCPLFGMFNQLNLPYMLSWILGMVLGDWRTGLIVGAVITTLNMAPVVIGAVQTMNLWDAAVLCVALVVGQGMDIEVACAIAAAVYCIVKKVKNKGGCADCPMKGNCGQSDPATCAKPENGGENTPSSGTRQ